MLFFESNRLGEATVEVESHAGQHSHPKQPSEGGAGVMKPLLVMAGLGAMALRDPERRKKAISMARDGATQVKARLSKQEKPDSGYDPPPTGRGYSGTSTVGSTPRPGATAATPAFGASAPAALATRQRTPREEAIVREVTLAFPAMNLIVTPIAVHNLEGGETETLRFTLDETASSDLELGRLERSTEPESTLADELISDLRTQLPPDTGNPPTK